MTLWKRTQLLRQLIGGTLIAALNGVLVGMRLCKNEFDQLFWSALVLLVLGVAMTVQAALKMEPRRGGSAAREDRSP